MRNTLRSRIDFSTTRSSSTKRNNVTTTMDRVHIVCTTAYFSLLQANGNIHVCIPIGSLPNKVHLQSPCLRYRLITHPPQVSRRIGSSRKASASHLRRGLGSETSTRYWGAGAGLR